MPTGAEIVAEAERFRGWKYRLGAEVDPSGANWAGYIDCSELVQVACVRKGIMAPDGTVNQFPWAHKITIAQAIETPGALLFVWKGMNAGGGNGNHVAISRGDGTTMEARSTSAGVGNFSAHGRGWTHGALIPGVDYRKPIPLPPPPAPPTGEDEDMKPAYVHYRGSVYRSIGNVTTRLDPLQWDLAKFFGATLIELQTRDQAVAWLGGQFDTRTQREIVIP